MCMWWYCLRSAAAYGCMPLESKVCVALKGMGAVGVAQLQHGSSQGVNASPVPLPPPSPRWQPYVLICIRHSPGWHILLQRKQGLYQQAVSPDHTPT
jgi:hypothetical protein